MGRWHALPTDGPVRVKPVITRGVIQAEGRPSMRSSAIILALAWLAVGDSARAQTYPAGGLPSGAPADPVVAAPGSAGGIASSATDGASASSARAATDPSPSSLNSAPSTAPAAAASPTAWPAADPGLPTPVYSRVSSFAIPFSVAQPEKQSLEVLLFVSADYGANWTLYGRQTAGTGQFPFRTVQDGEYWFASRVSPIGTVVSTGATFRPELRVIVDSAEPRLEVQAAVRPDGELYVEWRAVDDQLAPETLTVEYQEAIGRPYRSVPAPPGQQPARNIATGSVSWRPEQGSYFVSIRVQVRDRAGNSAEAVRRLILPVPLSNQPPAPTATAPTAQETDAPPDPLSGYGMPADPQARGSGSPAASVEQLAPEAAAQQGQRPPTAPPAGTAWPSEQSYGHDLYREPYSSQYAAAAPAGSGGSATSPATDRADEDRARGSPPERDAAAMTARSVASSSADPVEGGPARRGEPLGSAPSEAPPSERTPAETPPSEASPSKKDTTASERTTNGAPLGGSPTAELPAGERPRMTASKRFNLDYSVDAVGPAGVEKVELWVTRNGGRDWDLGWVDADCQSPLLVEVEDEGIYGFRLVIVGKNGLASQTPRSGDLADLWIGVDTTKPTVEITSAAYGSGDHGGQLDIRWTAADLHLANRPITLSFSSQPDGPWTTIAAGLPNSGQYYWRVDSRVPDEFYLRIEVRDEAGNIAVHRLDQPLQSAGLTPKASIRGFLPAGP